MILTNGNISQSKIVETSQFVFKPTNIGLLIEKYDNCNNIFTKPSARAGYDTGSAFKRSLTGLNSEFSFS